MVLDDIARTYSRNRDFTWLSIYTAIILVSGVIVGRMVGTAFGGHSGFRETVRALIEMVPSVTLVNVAAVVVGFYLGLLFLLFVDFKKRIQSLLMIFGTGIGFFIITVEGVLFPWMSVLDFALVLISFISTLLIIGGETFRSISIDPDSLWSGIITNENNEPVEFKRAATFLKMLVGIFVIITFVEAYTDYEPLLLMEGSVQPNVVGMVDSFSTVGSETDAGIDLLFSFLLIVTFVQFLDYDTSKRIMFIGPPRSGKTHTIIALYSEAQNSEFNARDPAQYLSTQKNFMATYNAWAPETEAEVHDMSFIYSTKGLFSKNVYVDGLDYPGEYIYYIAEGLHLISQGMSIPSKPVDRSLPPSINFGSGNIGKQINRKINNPGPWADALIENSKTSPPDSNYDTFEDEYIAHIRTTTGGDPSQISDTPPDEIYVQMIQSVLPRIREADTLVFAFDVNQALEFLTGDDAKHVAVEQYNDIAAVADANRYIGIATKSDLLKEDFYNEHRLRPPDDPELFRSHVENKLLSTPFGAQIQALQLDLYPVYIEAEESNEVGEQDQPLIPIKPYGTEKLLQELGKK